MPGSGLKKNPKNLNPDSNFDRYFDFSLIKNVTGSPAKKGKRFLLSFDYKGLKKFSMSTIKNY